MLPFVAIGGILMVFLLMTAKPSAAKKNSGIGGAFKGTNGVVAFPTGTVATSVASLGSSIFGGSGTHNPVDTSIKSPGAMGTPQSSSGIVTNADLMAPSSSSSGTSGIVTNADLTASSTSSNVPSSQAVATQIDASAVNANIDVPATDSAVTYSDFGG